MSYDCACCTSVFGIVFASICCMYEFHKSHGDMVIHLCLRMVRHMPTFQKVLEEAEPFYEGKKPRGFEVLGGSSQWMILMAIWKGSHNLT